MVRILFLWTLIFSGSLSLSGSHVHISEGQEDFEVVRPVRIHTVRKRNTEGTRPETVKYGIKLRGRDIEMHLEKNNDFLGKDYTETYYQDDGTQVTTTPTDIDHCYYHGKILHENESSVSISTCDGLRGYFKTAEQEYLIEPMSGSDDGDHKVTTLNEKNFTPGVCGVTNTTWSNDFEPPTSRSRSRSGITPIVYEQKYIELVLVVDNRAFVKWNKDQTALRGRIFEVVNFVNLAYKSLRTFVALVGLEIWSKNDLISVTPPAGANLGAFMNWRNNNLIKRKKHDMAHLISGIDFEGATVGLAYIGTLCSGHSVGVVQDHNDRAIAVGATLAHEMGHNLGMDHDDSSACACEGESCIMAAALSWNVPRTFSSCSSNSYERYLTKRTPSCMLDKPDYRTIVAPSVCGNKFVEEGEQCDCGTVEECTNPCCNATTCRLTEGSQCADGVCCDKCKIAPRTKECRSKQDDCDLPEYCDGKGATCPEDMFAVNGLPCDAGNGYCYNGMCPQRMDQCVKMYGSGATEAKSSCYNQNKRGTYYAFCRRPKKDQYIPCQQQDVFCGKLFCEGGNASPNYGRMVSVGVCKATFYSDHNQDYGQVDTGTICGDGKVCSQNECMDLETAYRNINCSAKCPGHAVCNHKSQCQCEPGWMPPSCDTKYGETRPLDIGPTVAIALTVILVVLGAIAGVVGFMWKKRQSPTLPTINPKRGQPAVNSAPPQNKASAPSLPVTAPQVGRSRPNKAPPPPPPAGNKAKPQQHSYLAARQALRPVPPPKV